MRCARPRWAVLLLVLTAVSGIARGAATSPQVLVEVGQLEAALVVESGAPYYRRAPLILAVEIGTPRWFTRGTRVADIRIPGALVRPVSAFAVNETRRRGQETWTVQRWRFRVYPQDSGRLAIPPVRVSLSVSVDATSTAEGELVLRHPPITVEDPPGLDGAATDWFAAAAVTVEETWEGQRDDYRIGDAITRHRRIVIEDAPAMLLAGSATPAIDGLSLYAAPARVEDRSNRGRLAGVREETLVITMEAPGDYELPGLSIAWFNTREQRMEVLTRPAYVFSVQGAAATADGQRQAGAPRPASIRRLALLLALLLATAGLTALAGRRLRRRAAALRGALRARRAYRHALRHGQWREAHALLTRRAAQRGKALPLFQALGDDAEARAALRALLAAGYGDGGDGPSIEAAQGLWRSLGRRAPRRARDGGLHLNPAAWPPP